MKKYLNILIDAIKKKDFLLDRIRAIIDEQEEAVSGGITEEALQKYSSLMEKKGEIIEQLDKLDDGFASVYARVSPELKKSSVDYSEQIRMLQDMITTVSEKTALIQAKEIRVHNTLDRMSRIGHKQVDVKIGRSHAAQQYYKTMKKTTVEPGSIFVDTKKKK